MPGRREGLQVDGVAAADSDDVMLKRHLASLDMELCLAVSLSYELGFSRDEAAFVMGVDSAKLEDLAALGLKRLQHLLAEEGLERLPAEISETIRRLPLAPVPERLKAWMVRLLEEVVPEQSLSCPGADRWTGGRE